MIRLVCTEAASHLDAPTRRRYEAIAGQLEALAGQPCALEHYSAVTHLGGVAAVVLSGSLAPWEAHPPGGFEPLRRALAAAPAPTLGICAGMQLLTWFGGGEVDRLPTPETGFAAVELHADDPLFAGLEPEPVVFQEHTHGVTRLAEGYVPLASSAACPYQAMRRDGEPVWAVQFHPERADEAHPAGEQLLRNFFAQLS